MAKKYGLRCRFIVMGGFDAREKEFPLIHAPTEEELKLFLGQVAVAARDLWLKQQNAVDAARAQIDARYDPEAGR